MVEIRNKWKNRIVEEDKLFNENVLKIIENLHGKIFKVERHYKVANLETDIILLCKRIRGYKSVGIELKVSDTLKAIEQAIARRKYFNYFYIVSDVYNPYSYLGYEIEYLFKYQALDKLKEYYIGWIISNFEGQAYLIFPSFYFNAGFRNTLYKFMEE